MVELNVIFFYHRLATVPNIIEELLRTENFKKHELGLKHASFLEENYYDKVTVKTATFALMHD